MKLKLDENMPAQLPGILRSLGHDTDSVADEGLLGESDEAIWNAAQREKRLLVTQDMDFSDLRKLIAGDHFGPVLLRLRATSRRKLIDRVEAVFRSDDAAGWRGALVIVSEGRMKVRHAQKHK